MAKSADAWGRGGHIFTAFRLQTGLALEKFFLAIFRGQYGTIQLDVRGRMAAGESRLPTPAPLLCYLREAAPWC